MIKEPELSWMSSRALNETSWCLGILQFILLILFATVTGSEVLGTDDAPGNGAEGYNMFVGVEIMM